MESLETKNLEFASTIWLITFLSDISNITQSLCVVLVLGLRFGVFPLGFGVCFGGLFSGLVMFWLYSCVATRPPYFSRSAGETGVN